MTSLSSKIECFLAGAVVGAILEAGSISNALRGENSIITAITRSPPTQYHKSHPSDLNCSEMERRIRVSQSSTPKIPADCEFYTNPFWQYICNTPEQYDQVNSYYQWREQLDLLREWQVYRKCEQGDKRKL